MPLDKVKWLTVAGIVSLLAGAVFGWLGLCPVVKRIWTPSWTIFSGGWCFLLTAVFYLLVDLAGKSRWFFFFTVIGMNSIAAYCMAHLFDGFILQSLKTHLGADTFALFGTAYQSLLLGTGVLLVLWLILFWMYRRKLFLRI